ncbi:hypothetical protein F4810DRAFT_718133 [Camillea tinctor]|nr:hypothetical protein F4810DRAFT_718133 [Camillea tinctor]
MPKVKYHSSCDACLGSKVKCSQTKPCCARCAQQSYECVYGQYKPIGRPSTKAFRTLLLHPGTKARQESGVEYCDSKKQRLNGPSPYPLPQHVINKKKSDTGEPRNRHLDLFDESSPVNYPISQHRPLNLGCLASPITDTTSQTDLEMVDLKRNYISSTNLAIDTIYWDKPSTLLPGEIDILGEVTPDEPQVQEDSSPHYITNYLHPQPDSTSLIQQTNPEAQMEGLPKTLCDNLGLTDPSASFFANPSKSWEMPYMSDSISSYNYDVDKVSIININTPKSPERPDCYDFGFQNLPRVDKTHIRCTMRCHSRLNEHLTYLTDIQATKYNLSLDSFFNIDATVGRARNKMLHCPVCFGNSRCIQTLLLITMVQAKLLELFEREYTGNLYSINSDYASLTTSATNTSASLERPFPVSYTHTRLNVGKVQIDESMKLKFSTRLLKMYVRRQSKVIERLKFILLDIRQDYISSKVTRDLLDDILSRTDYLLGIIELTNGKNLEKPCRIVAPRLS